MYVPVCGSKREGKRKRRRKGEGTRKKGGRKREEGGWKSGGRPREAM